MKLLTSRLNEPTRSAVRFTVVGTIGTGVQYALYYAFLMLFAHLYGEEDSAFWANVAFMAALYAVCFVLPVIFSKVFSKDTDADTKSISSEPAAETV